MRASTIGTLTVLLLFVVTSAGWARQLSSDCQTEIPACTPKRCLRRVIGKTETSVCLRCLPSYTPVRGSDNRSIIQCVCPKGTFQVINSGDRSCRSCPIGYWCPGVNDSTRRVTKNSIGGEKVPCSVNSTDGLTTKTTGSSKLADCVAEAGYVLPWSRGEAAQQCQGSSYAPAFNRLRSCKPCPGGLQAPPDFQGFRTNKEDVCQVQPGLYLDRNALYSCQPGTYRSGWVKASDSASRSCLQCPEGWTTANGGATDARMCNVIRPGYQLISGGLEAQSPELAEVQPCGYGYFSAGSTGVCTLCPFRSVTLDMGATSVEGCVVPPGYYVRATDDGLGEMLKCPVTAEGTDEEGYYRPDWKSYRDVISMNAAGDGKDICLPCGKGIPSRATEPDESPTAPPGTLVAATDTSCFIRPGWGVDRTTSLDPITGSVLETLEVVAPCPANTYGAAVDTFGRASMEACTPCGTNLVASPGSKGFEDCKNPAGFGYSTGGAYPCPLDTWAAAGSMSGCQKCPDGRITLTNSTSSPDQCLVPPGYGVYSNMDGQNPWSPQHPTSVMPVKPCPAGYYSTGDAPGISVTQNPVCQACVGSSTTLAAGSSSCNACIPGYGRTTGSSQCSVCHYGSYNPGGSESCTQCPTSTYTSIFGHIDGAIQSGSGSNFSSLGTTFQTGLTSPDKCVPRYALQAGASLALPDAMFTVNVSVLGETSDSLAAEQCVQACPSDVCCIAALSKSLSGNVTCRHAQLAPVAPDIADNRTRLFYKLPSSMQVSGAADSITAADQGTPDYATLINGPAFAVCDIHAWAVDAEAGSVGVTLSQTLPPGSSVNAIEWNVAGCMTIDSCKQACRRSADCWGFIWVPGVKSKTRIPGGFALRGFAQVGDTVAGSSLISTFFVSPDGNQGSGSAEVSAFDVGNLNW